MITRTKPLNKGPQAWELWHPDACAWAMENIPSYIANYTFFSFIWTWFFRSNRFISERIYEGFTRNDNPWQMLFLCWLPSLILSHGVALFFKKGGCEYWFYPFLFVIFVCYFLDSGERIIYSAEPLSFDWWFHVFRFISIVVMSTLIAFSELTRYLSVA